MNFQFITNLVEQIIKAIENSSIVAVRSVLTHTFPVKVTNPVKKVDVKGTVVVGNLKNLDKPLKDIKQAVFEVKRSVDGKTTDVRITNFPQSYKLSNPYTDEKVVEGLSKLEMKVQSLHKPLELLKKVEITNQPTEQLDNIAMEAGRIYKAVKSLKLDPKINVEAPKQEKILVPPAKVTVERVEIDYTKLAKAIADQIEGIDYKKLESIFKGTVGEIRIGGGGTRVYTFQKYDGTKTQALVDDNGRIQTSEDATKMYTQDVEEGSTYTYIGKANRQGEWEITRITNATQSFRYMSGASGYEDSWNNKEALSYNYIYA